jgi:cyclopropane fatty-acyl-phospholipid synthase-like methyltransferase
MAAKDEPWWISFFAGAWGEHQEAGYPPERTRAEVDFILRSLDLASGARILDLPCGEGRHAI